MAKDNSRAVLREEGIRKAILEVAHEVSRDALHYFEKAIEKERLVLSGDLRNSLQYEINDEADSFAALANINIDIFFKEYGRFKDIKRMRWQHMPPVEELEEFVKKVGLNKFAFVNGYNEKSVPTVDKAVKRLAWTFAMYKKKIPVHKQQTQWYNRTKAAYFNVLSRRINSRMAEIMPQYMKEILENQA